MIDISLGFHTAPLPSRQVIEEKERETAAERFRERERRTGEGGYSDSRMENEMMIMAIIVLKEGGFPRGRLHLSATATISSLN